MVPCAEDQRRQRSTGALWHFSEDSSIELRFVPRLQPLIEAMRGCGLGFFVIRARNALPVT